MPAISSRQALFGCAVLLGATAAGFAAPRCPEGAERVATSRAERPWACVLLDGPEEDGDCPEGTTEITVLSRSRPFRCAVEEAEPEAPAAGAPEAAPGRTERRRCPKGFAPAFTKDSKRGYRCVRKTSARDVAGGAAPAPKALAARPPKTKPRAACPAGTRRVRTEDPFEPVRCVPAGLQTAPPLGNAYARYEVPRELAFEYPETWNVTDAWKDEVPSIFIQPDLKRDGKPVILTVSRYRADRSPYTDMDSAIRREIEWQGAKEGGRRAVAGLPARFLEVSNQSKSAYVRTATGYFVLAYSAPEDLFRIYAPAFARLLKSLRVVHGEKDPMPEEE